MGVEKGARDEEGGVRRSEYNDAGEDSITIVNLRE